MFYKNKSTLKTLLSLMVNNTDDSLLMNNIKKAFDYVDTNDIKDVETKHLCNTVKDISKNIQDKGIRTPDAAKMYISHSSLNEETKNLLLGMNHRYTDSVVKEFTYLLSKMRHTPTLDGLMDTLSDKFDNLRKTGIETIQSDLDSFLDIARQFNEEVIEVAKEVADNDVFFIDVSKEKDNTYGTEKLSQSIYDTEHNRIKTGMWIDHLTGGGFTNKALYIACSIAGGFKSGFLQNIAEFVSMAMKPEDFLVADGLTPCVYYLNLEMTQMQMVERRLAFYKENLSDLLNKIETDPESTNIIKELSNVLRKNNSVLPVIYEQGAMNYGVAEIKMKLKEMERQGYKIAFLIVDYIDLLRYESTQQDQLEIKAPIVSKAEQLRALAIEFNIPVLTAAQLNREAEKALKENEHRAAREDLVLRTSSGHLAKAHALKAIPEQIYMVYKSTINDNSYVSVVVDKDRQNKGHYVESDYDKENTGKEVKYKKNKNLGSRVLFVAKLDDFRISNVYSNSITNFEEDAADEVFSSMEVAEIEE